MLIIKGSVAPFPHHLHILDIILCQAVVVICDIVMWQLVSRTWTREIFCCLNNSQAPYSPVLASTVFPIHFRFTLVFPDLSQRMLMEALLPVCFSLLSAFLQFSRLSHPLRLPQQLPEPWTPCPKRLFFLFDKLSPTSCSVNHLASPLALIFSQLPKSP